MESSGSQRQAEEGTWGFPVCILPGRWEQLWYCVCVFVCVRGVSCSTVWIWHYTSHLILVSSYILNYIISSLCHLFCVTCLCTTQGVVFKSFPKPKSAWKSYPPLTLPKQEQICSTKQAQYRHANHPTNWSFSLPFSFICLYSFLTFTLSCILCSGWSILGLRSWSWTFTDWYQDLTVPIRRIWSQQFTRPSLPNTAPPSPVSTSTWVNRTLRYKWQLNVNFFVECQASRNINIWIILV